ncbi:MAG: hypothetical protein ACR2FI_00200 [Burkholderiales bacterium]
MIYYLTKLMISAALIVAVSEIAKRSSLLGGLLASLPLVSLLAMIWLYVDTGSSEQVIALSRSIFWLALPSLPLFLLLPALLKKDWAFYPALMISGVAMFALYYLMLALLRRFGVQF